jgi:hypothetical protein
MLTYKFQIRHIPTGGFVRMYEVTEGWKAFYIAPMGQEGSYLSDSECKAAFKKLCDVQEDHPYMLEEFILVRTLDQDIDPFQF